VRHWRVIIWGGGFLTVLLAALLESSGWFAHSSLSLSLFLGWAALAVVAEISALAATLLRPASRTAVLTAAPPDGLIECCAVQSVEGVPNAIAQRFRRFARLTTGAYRADNDRQDIGLRGRVVFISLFIGRDGTHWSEPEVAQVLSSLETAGRWIEREAERWQAAVNIALADTYFEELDEADEPVAIELVSEAHQPGLFESAATVKAMASATRAVARLGFAGVADWVETIGPRLDADQTIWLIHPRSAGRSHAIPPGQAPLPRSAFAVCFAGEANFPSRLTGSAKPDSATYAHEILHLFGASDKYGAEPDRFDPADVTERDIMRLAFRSLGHMRVDRLTAAEIGWA
jgi:hypothetical protein